MSDILSSFSLLLTIVTVLYGTWYQEIRTAIDHWEDIPDRTLEKQFQEYLDGKLTMLRTKLLPLTIAGVVLVALMIPVVWEIIGETAEAFKQHGLGAVCFYDTVKATIVVVFIFGVVLCAHLWQQSAELKRGIEKCGTPSETS